MKKKYLTQRQIVEKSLRNFHKEMARFYKDFKINKTQNLSDSTAVLQFKYY